MITKKNNSIEQKELFQKAWQELSKRGWLSNENPNQTTFTNLAHYFSYLEQLSEIDPIYIMLPIDEKPFKIDANTRKIEIPPDFLNRCCEVQSDNYAEIITFTIDRYFDYKDLMETQIAVQWQNKAANTYGIDKIKLIDLKTFGEEEKIRFGWPITKKMTAAAGNLEFAVRFFTQPDVPDADYEYLLSTLPTSIPIKSTLAIKEGLTESIVDTNAFKNFITNSQNPSYATPTPVVFQHNLPNNIHLDPSSNTDSLKILAGSADGGNIIYDWYLIKDVYEEYTDDIWPPISEKTLYIPVDEYNYNPYPTTGNIWPEEKPNTIEKFYKKTSELIPLVDNDDFSLLDAELNSQYYEIYDVDQNNGKRPVLATFWVDEGNNKVQYTGSWPPPKDTIVYLKYEQLTFKPSDKEILGTYYVKGTNRVVDNKGNVVNKHENYSNHCKIAPPNRIECISATGSQFFDNVNALNNKIEITLNSDEYADRKFSIYKNEELYDDNKDVDGNIISYQVDGVGKYNVSVKSTLNRAVINKENIGGDIHFYQAATEPVLEDDIGLAVDYLDDDAIVKKEGNILCFFPEVGKEYGLCVNVLETSADTAYKWSISSTSFQLDELEGEEIINSGIFSMISEDKNVLYFKLEKSVEDLYFTCKVTNTISHGNLISSKSVTYVFNTFDSIM